jgi:hypothetical protein
VKRDRKGEARDYFTASQVSAVVSHVHALTEIAQSKEFGPHNFEPHYNIALLASKAGQFQVLNTFSPRSK